MRETAELGKRDAWTTAESVEGLLTVVRVQAALRLRDREVLKDALLEGARRQDRVEPREQIAPRRMRECSVWPQIGFTRNDHTQ
jgi:hypothetical protein